MSAPFVRERFDIIKQHELDFDGGTVRGWLNGENLDSIIAALTNMRDMVRTASMLEARTPWFEIQLGPGWVKDFFDGLPQK